MTIEPELLIMRTPASVWALRHPDDPEGRHDFTVQDGVGMRRARRIDVWLDEVIVINSAFQDRATTPSGGRAEVPVLLNYLRNIDHGFTAPGLHDHDR